MKPLLWWAGGKQRLIDKIVNAFAGDRCQGTFYDPFFGGGSVALALLDRNLVDTVVASDINPKLIAFHKSIRDQVEDIITEFEKLPKTVDKADYYRRREVFNQMDPTGPAYGAMFLWINRACFNGLFHENKAGQFRVSCGHAGPLRSMPTHDQMRAVSRTLKRVEIRCQPFEDAICAAGSNDWVYCDPPYVPLNSKRKFNTYTANGFTLEQQMQVAKQSVRAAKRGARVVISNRDMPMVRKEIYPVRSGFEHLTQIDIHHSLGGTSARGAELISRVTPSSVEAVWVNE